LIASASSEKREHHIVGFDVGQPERPDTWFSDHTAAGAEWQRDRLCRIMTALAMSVTSPVA
jgi:hypothetical protein